MNWLRSRFSVHPRLALLLAVLAFALKAATPPGFMPGLDGNALVLQPCPQVTAAPATTHAGMEHHASENETQDDERGPVACPYAVLATPIVAQADVAPVPTLPLFAVTIAFFPRTFALAQRQARFRPPSRGPPLLS